MKKYILISPGGETSKYMLSDLKTCNIDKFQYIDSAYKFQNKLQEKLFWLYYKINARISLPFGFVWNKVFTISHIDFKKEDEYFIILGNGNFNYYNSIYLNKLKEKYNIHYIVYFIDPLSGLMSKYMKRNIFNLNVDQLYTFDYADSIKRKMKHTMCLYSKCKMEEGSNNKKVFFLGTNKKGRVDIINRVAEMFDYKKIDYDFRIVNVPIEKQLNNKIKYNVRMKYLDMLQEIQNCNCIFEVLQQGQTGVTLRYYEAVVYNKKLITNNKIVENLSFYNPEYIQIYENIEDIDVEWIKKDIDVSYDYHGEYSPVNFIYEIMNDRCGE